MSIHLVHGIIDIDNWSPKLRMHRLYAPASRFREYLKNRPTKYRDWGPESDHDVLTVDDSTNAAAAVCLMARELGHGVTFFVNPHQIMTQRPYFFSYLDMYIDARSCSAFTYRGVSFDLTTSSQIPAFRSAARTQLMCMDADDHGNELEMIRTLIGAPLGSVPQYAEPLTRQTLVALHDHGVRIQNHGWAHVEIAAQSDADFARDFADTQEWIRQLTGMAAGLYAVPFGHTRVTPSRREAIGSVCLLADSRTPLGPLADGHVNRLDITSQFQDFAR